MGGNLPPIPNPKTKMKIRFIGAKYHPLAHKVRINENHEATVDEGLGLSLITRHPLEWEEVKEKVKTKPAKAVRKKSLKTSGKKK